MAIPVLILGESGTGKTTSLRNCSPDAFGLINVSRKPLPFRSALKPFNTDDYARITAALAKATVPSLVIDDSQYLMVNAFMRRSKEKGYDKYTDIASAHWSLIDYVIFQMPDDKIVYFMSHIERDQQGNEKAKTVGRMIDQYITLEGLFTIVLKTHVQDGRYTFLTHNSGFDTVKTPLGMFASDEIDNDLAVVDKTIREYYNLTANKEEPSHDQTR